ncbi:NADH:ubiquinone dehydrogenase [Culex quinquefasciatus]|uniref:NADH:ubiquinone dehydrogenase n=1 Tax=Culex quinquefasciatus TaxID=7176 RepID=B0WA75_CULQU|nr:cytochrome c oxidase subunit NDUFA4 [Culex quinquefasciatus]EDS40904.1 NADH:ubiquinone dehydrogenase [Culex quinquefasciatus]|eukprot:XP_001845609.1 NADH:ubiquinone dehydrogenase [Culex quinquefasciatus]
MQGMSLASIKKNPALIPLYVCIGLGAAAAVFYTARLAIRSPEVTWSRKNNPEPWEEYRNKQHKFYSPVRDYSKVESQAPKYTE